MVVAPSRERLKLLRHLVEREGREAKVESDPALSTGLCLPHRDSINQSPNITHPTTIDLHRRVVSARPCGPASLDT